MRQVYDICIRTNSSDCLVTGRTKVSVHYATNHIMLASPLNTQQAIGTWHSSGPDTGKHISSHHAVKAADERSSQRKTQRMLFHNDLNDAYENASKQATKRSLFSPARFDSTHPNAMGSRGEDHCMHWGKRVDLAGPWSSETAAALTQGMYAGHPGLIHTRQGQSGACAAGTCGGSAGCGSGAITLCGTGCTGVSF